MSLAAGSGSSAKPRPCWKHTEKTKVTKKQCLKAWKESRRKYTLDNPPKNPTRRHLVNMGIPISLWIRVGRCEQPGRGYMGVRWSHPGPKYEGGLGFFASSWDAYRPSYYPSNAGNATWQQQMVVASRLWDRAGWGWGCDVR